MKRKLRIVGIVVAVMAVAIIALPFGLNVNSFRPKLEAELSSALGRPVTVGNLSLSLMARTVSAQDLAIGDDPAFSQDPFVRAKSLKVGVEVLPLIFSKTLHVTELTLERPEIALLRSGAGTWNFSSLAGTAPATPSPSSPGNDQVTNGLSVSKLEVKDGRVTIGHAGSPTPRIYDHVNVSLRNFSFGSPFPFTLSASLPNGGTLKLDGNAGPISTTDASLSPFQSQIAVKSFDLAASGIGELSPGIAGIADFNGTVNSDGQTLRTSGTLQASKLKLVQSGGPAGRPLQLKYAIAHQLQGQTGTISESDIAMGKAVAQLTGNYRIQGQTANLDLKLNAQSMPVDDIEAMLPALGVVLPSGSRLSGGTLSASLTIVGPADNPVINGPIRLSNSRLAGFDFGSKLSAISKLSAGKTGTDTSIENLSTVARVAPDGVRTENVNLTIPAFGVLTGSGTISPGGALNYKMTVNLSGAVASAVTQLVGLGNKGETIPFYIRGTTSNPSFVPDVHGMLTGQIGSQLGNALKNKLEKKSAVKSFQPSAQPKTSVINKITGWFHRKKKDQSSKK
jgi:AsmA protein